MPLAFTGFAEFGTLKKNWLNVSWWSIFNMCFWFKDVIKKIRIFIISLPAEMEQADLQPLFLSVVCEAANLIYLFINFICTILEPLLNSAT